MNEDQIFFVGQKAFIKNKNNEILVLYDAIIGLDLPGGKIQTGEVDLISSLKREVKEETDLIIDVKKPFYTWVFNYPIQKEGLDKIFIEAGFEWRASGKATVVYTDLGISSGMEFGIEHAKKQGRPIEFRLLPKELLAKLPE